MKRPLLIFGGILAVLAIGWGVLWNAGREQVNARIDAEIAALRQIGTEVTIAERAIGGFPLAYELNATDIVVSEGDGQRIYRLPELTARTELNDSERLVVNLPETFSLEFLPSEEARAERPDLPEKFELDFETVAAQVVTTGRPGSARTVETTAESFLLVSGDAEAETSFALELAQFASRAEQPPEITGSPVELTASAALIDYVARGKSENGAAMTFEGQIEAVQVNGTSLLRSLDQVQAMLNGRLTQGFDLNVTSGKNISRVNTSGGGSGPAGSFTSQAGTSTALISMQDGMLEIRGDTRASSFELTSEAEGPFKGGKVDIELMDVVYTLPFVPTPDMQPFAVKLAFVDIGMDDRIWSAIDPGETLDRAPAQMVIDAEGTMRATKLQSEIVPGEPPPYQVGNLSLNAIDLKLLGATAEVKGDLEIRQPINQPIGEFDVRLTNVEPVLQTLGASGVLPPQAMLVAQIMLKTYTLPGETPEELVSKIEMTLDGLSVNGQSLGAP
ncbi:MAG: DUF2125 domain-containing protein [Pseudomonadota bacterium]